MTEYVILVDDQDQEIGVGEKIFVHKQAITHRAFSVFIYRVQNEQIEVLLQQRHSDKYHCGNLWTNTCCGHPRPQEDVKIAAERRLFEEMGLRYKLHFADKFHYIAKFANGLTEDEIDHVFFAKDDGQAIQPNTEEVMNYQWMNVIELKQSIKNNSRQFTPWLLQALLIAEKDFNN